MKEGAQINVAISPEIRAWLDQAKAARGGTALSDRKLGRAAIDWARLNLPPSELAALAAGTCQLPPQIPPGTMEAKGEYATHSRRPIILGVLTASLSIVALVVAIFRSNPPHHADAIQASRQEPLATSALPPSPVAEYTQATKEQISTVDEKYGAALAALRTQQTRDWNLIVQKFQAIEKRARDYPSQWIVEPQMVERSEQP